MYSCPTIPALPGYVLNLFKNASTCACPKIFIKCLQRFLYSIFNNLQKLKFLARKNAPSPAKAEILRLTMPCGYVHNILESLNVRIYLVYMYIYELVNIFIVNVLTLSGHMVLLFYEKKCGILERYIMDALYVIFIQTVHQLSLFFFFLPCYFLEGLYLTVHI